MNLVPLALFFLCTAVMGVVTGPEETEDQVQLKLKIGEEQRLKNEGLRIRFVSVVEDSRCPKNVNCVWAGNGKVLLNIADRRKKSRSVELNTNLEPRAVTSSGYEIKLLELDPYPVVNETIQPDKYVAILAIRKL